MGRGVDILPVIVATGGGAGVHLEKSFFRATQHKRKAAKATPPKVFQLRPPAFARQARRPPIKRAKGASRHGPPPRRNQNHPDLATLPLNRGEDAVSYV